MNELTSMASQFHILAKEALALLLGMAIGLNRQIAGKPAGVRTQMLVAGAACLVITLGPVMANSYMMFKGTDLVRLDTVGLVSSIITGIGFIGAGTIIYHRKENMVEGLTTAATLLFSAFIGIATGLEQYIVATGSTAMVVIILVVFNRLDKYLNNKLIKRYSHEDSEA